MNKEYASVMAALTCKGEAVLERTDDGNPFNRVFVCRTVCVPSCQSKRRSRRRSLYP